MADLLLRLFGKGTDALPEGAETKLMLTNAPSSWQVFLLLAVVAVMVAVIVYLYRRESGNLTRAWRVILGVFRALVVLCVVLIFLGPAIGVSTRQVVDPYVLVLADDSHSMSMQDRYRDAEALRAAKAFTGRETEDLRAKPPTRMDLVNRLFRQNDGAFVKELSRRGRVQVMSFSDRLRLREAVGAEAAPSLPGNQEIERAGPVPPLTAQGPSTNMGRCLRDAVQSVAGSKVAAIVLLTDGRDTATEDPQGMAAQMRQQGIPLFAVPFGDPTEPRNLRVSEVWAPESVTQEDPFAIQAQVQSRNLDAKKIEIELVEKLKDGDKGSGTVVDRKTVDVTEGIGVYSLSFVHKPKKAGTFVYTVRAPLQDEELLESDNERQAVVRVLDQKARVLLVSSGPSWDYRMLRNLLTRDKTVDVSCWLQSMDPNLKQEGNTSIDRLPSDPKKLFVYDGIIFMDPNPIEFGQAWVELVKAFVHQHGGGIMWVAGQKHTAQFLQSNRGAGIREVMPVRFATGASNYQVTLRRTWTKEWPVRLRGSGVDHPMLQLNRDPKLNAKLWERMPGVYWSFRTDGAKPGTQVLMEHSDPNMTTEDGAMPLLTIGRAGPGRVMFMAFNDSWRWRRAGEEHFERFWVQAVRELASGRHMRGKGRGQIMTDRDRYGLGDRIQITARLYDDQYRPLVDASFSANLVNGDDNDEKVDFQPLPSRPGVYEASVTARFLGVNEIKLRMPGGSGEQLSRRFTVEVPNVEFAEPQLNRVFLENLTAQSGGALIPLDKAMALVDDIPNRRESLVVRAKPIPLWDTWAVLIVLVVLLAVEWAMRKRFHLI